MSHPTSDMVRKLGQGLEWLLMILFCLSLVGVVAIAWLVIRMFSA